MRKFMLVGAALLAFAFPASSLASVGLVSVTSPARPGSTATLSARVTGRSSTCFITVYYKSGPSHAPGLFPRRPAAGRVSWTWFVGTNTTPGRWPITVDCGLAGSLRTAFLVS